MQVGIQDDESKRCMFSGCSQVDYLATRCTYCGGIYCCDHTPANAHNCRIFNSKSLTCPLCGTNVPLEYNNQRPDEAVSRHMDRGCRPLQPQRNTKERLNYCSYANCTKNEHASIICEDCKNMYCIEHRAPARHHCRAIRISPALSSVKESSSAGTSSQVATSPSASSPSRGVPRNTPSTAFGKKTEDSVTPLILFASEFAVVPFFMHFSRLIVVGRLVDLALAQASLDSSKVSKAKGPWVPHVLQRHSDSSSGLSVFTPRLSATLKEAGVVDGVMVYIGTQEVLPKEVLEALTKRPEMRRRKSSKDGNCSLM
ncbi:AN1-type zinc finger protein 2B [Trypanosoma theileri]|uniref:AN1-type zinc finger protein 2B n=1 Tax=Trypanosoma theileri TaxID=67003 RepID=A0A1X0P6Y8_9TRYP|nr:AN1-type zinc finger protein 2B [Trypanosoma theileri]ORC92707.1 AN1-type zinc finger protein 2B [Trypanosoma theileri]